LPFGNLLSQMSQNGKVHLGSEDQHGILSALL